MCSDYSAVVGRRYRLRNHTGLFGLVRWQDDTEEVARPYLETLDFDVIKQARVEPTGDGGGMRGGRRKTLRS